MSRRNGVGTRQAAIDANARLNAMLIPSRRRRSAAVAVAVHNDNVRNDDSDGLISEQGSDASSSSTEEPEEPEESECSICYERPSAENVATIGGCDHKFCLDCITTWSERNNVCPLCRVRFTSIESTGGVLHQVPDRRPTGSRDIAMNFASLFNLEVEDRIAPVHINMRELLAELRESHARLEESMATLRHQRVVEDELNQMLADLHLFRG